MAKFKDKLNRGEAVIGTWINLTGPPIIEIIGRSGFDFLLIDGEHSPFNETDLRDSLIACDNTPAETLVRVRANEEPRIKLALGYRCFIFGADFVFLEEGASAAVVAARMAAP
jgi:4-hydroxy-2-oxoheptanedioate aldolase